MTSVSKLNSVKYIGEKAFKGTHLDRTPVLSKVNYIASNAFDTAGPLLWDFGQSSWIDIPMGGVGEEGSGFSGSLYDIANSLFETYPEARGIRSNHQLILNPKVALDDQTFAQFPWKEEVNILSLPKDLETLGPLKELKALTKVEVQKGYRLLVSCKMLLQEIP